MANLIRSAKSGSDWTENDLAAYNIQIQYQDAPTFFGVDHLPPPAVDQEVLTTADADDMVGDSNAELINLLDLAMVPTPEPGEESAVDDFAVALFSRLGYTKRHRVTRTRKDIPFLICGEWRYAKTDVCLIDRQQNDIILLVQEDKSLGGNLSSAECQLVAEAIAAFAQNNKRRQLCDMPIIESKVMPGITLIGTTPIFYKIPVSVELVRHVARGTYPSHSTIVSGHVPAVPRPFRRYSEGMKPVDTREAILRCYEAFKAVVGI